MLALVVAVALSQCTKDTDCKGDRLCVAGVCTGDRPAPIALDPRLDAQRPTLYWPVSSLITGAAFALAGIAAAAFDNSGPWLAAGMSIGGGLTFAGIVSLITTLWARAQ